MRESILNEIRKLAAENDGRAPGMNSFENATSIRVHEWRGIYWEKWSDAVREAGFEANERQLPYNVDFLAEKLAQAVRHYGELPSTIKMRMYQQVDATFPARQTFNKHFASRDEMLAFLQEWTSNRPDYADVADLLPRVETSSLGRRRVPKILEGFVYLICSGACYKVGRSDELERRVKEIRIALPEAATLIHAIRTDDPPGIEAYWHRRFAEKRANGEWFKLTSADLAAFKRRKYQ